MSPISTRKGSAPDLNDNENGCGREPPSISTPKGSAPDPKRNEKEGEATEDDGGSSSTTAGP